MMKELELAIDKDACEMLMYVDKFKVIELYTHHSVNKKHVLIQEPLGTASKPNEPDIGYGSEADVDVNEDECSSGSDSEDNDYFVDEENLIDDVNVDMAEFKSHTDHDVEWVGCKEKVVEENEVFDLEEVDHEDFDSGSDSDEDVRRKALRKVGRMNQAKFSKATFLSREVEESIKPNPKIPLSALKDQLQKKFEVGVSKQKVFRAKKMAYEKVVCNYTQQYAQLRDYFMELKEINPNTTVKIEVELPEVRDSEERKFKRRYISVGVDPNNGIYPLAYVVVESESKDSWKWFLDCLGDDLELFKNSNFTFISDRQKGVIRAIAETFPRIKNVKDAMATTIQKFDKRMEEMKNHNIEAYEWLRKIPPQHWPGRAKSNILLNNMSRCIKKALVDWNGSDLYQVSCPWVAAIWDMASNGTNTGIPESYCNPCHWLSTWKKMYRFNINPVNGPQAWKKSDVPTTIIPPKPHLQIGRPPKKRKKSAAELADEIMKSNKMTRPHIQHRLQLEEDARVKKVDMLVLVDKGMEMYVLVVHRPHKQLRVHFEESNILFIPDDIHEQILIRLDAEDLIRCKKVYKSWKSLISHPYFVKAWHTRQVNLMPYHMGIIPNYLFKYGLEHYMVGSSNGLACINSFDGDEIIVANPLTREERMLQKLPVSPVRSCWGFGYDALTDDYKVVFGAMEDWYLCNGALHWSLEGMEVVCQEFEATSKDPEGHSVDELITRDSDQKMHAAYPEALNQGMTDLGHLEGKIRKKKLCSEGWKRVYFSSWEIKEKVHLRFDPPSLEFYINAQYIFSKC
ncbi:mutator type transposase [Tanacetum coccineum]|uniref:Mutator type transposase n=1 Tax=Tanacetum coccineum TaxID=301880 RepID=A0ABQ5GRY6_9ASTR